MTLILFYMTNVICVVKKRKKATPGFDTLPKPEAAYPVYPFFVCLMLQIFLQLTLHALQLKG